MSLASRSGGLGDLTDGVVAAQRRDATPGLYVGWRSIDPDHLRLRASGDA